MLHFIKIIIFFLMAPIIYPMMFFMHATYGGHSVNDYKWFQKKIHEKKLTPGTILAILVSPLYLVISILLSFLHPIWEELLDD